MNWGRIEGLDRIGAVYQSPLVAVERVASGEWVPVYAGWVLVIWSPVLAIDGVLRVDGVVRVGHA